MTRILPSSELVSWKEIAAYLGCSVKTAQLWERDRGLPVRRLPGGHARVMALVAELEAWKISQAPDEAPPPAASSSRRVAWIIAACASFLLAGALWAGLRGTHPANPVSFRLESTSLVVLDGHGSEVWRHHFAQAFDPILSGKVSQILDLDGDGVPEVLFAFFPVEHASAPDTLSCFAHDGRLLWSYEPGKAIHTVAERFRPPFGIQQVVVAQLHPGSERTVIVTSPHVLEWPTQVSFLNPQGLLVGEYWHSGGIKTTTVATYDGVTSVYLGGINHAEHQAELVVLDPDRLGGASQERDPAYQLLDLPVAHERARLLLPRTAVNRTSDNYNQVSAVLHRPEELIVETWEHPGGPSYPTLAYHLSPGLSLLRVVPSDLLLTEHKAQFHHPFTSRDVSLLRLQRHP